MPIYTIRVEAKADITQMIDIEADDEETAREEAVQRLQTYAGDATVSWVEPDPNTRVVDVEYD